jgi:hypothetical protein
MSSLPQNPGDDFASVRGQVYEALAQLDEVRAKTSGALIVARTIGRAAYTACRRRRMTTHELREHLAAVHAAIARVREAARGGEP